jgi:hypothetical protein
MSVLAASDVSETDVSEDLSCQHTSAYVSIRQHTSAYASIAIACGWRYKLSRRRRAPDRSLRVSVCTFVLEKRVNWVILY